MMALREIGESQSAAAKQIKSITRDELTLDKLRYFSDQLDKHGQSEDVTVTYEGWLMRHRVVPDFEPDTPDDRIVVVKRAAEKMKKTLIALANETRAYSQL